MPEHPLRLVLVGKHVHSPVWEQNWLDLPLFSRLADASEKLLIISLGKVHRKTTTVHGNATLVLIPQRHLLVNNLLFVLQAAYEVGVVRRTEKWNALGASEPIGGGSTALLLRIFVGLPYMAMMQGDLLDLPKTHFSPLYRLAIARIMLLIASGAQLVRTVSERGKAKLVAGGIPAEKIVVLHNRVDHQRFSADNTAAFRKANRDRLGWNGSTVLLFAGALTVEKGFGDFLAACSTLLPRHRQLGVLIVGDGPLRQKAKDLASGASGRVHLTGFIPHDQIHNWLALGDILAFCSHHEGMPRVILEYMAMGKPIVTTDVGGIGEVIADCESGLIVKTGDTADLAAKIGRIADDPAAFAAMGAKARQSAETRHDLEATVAGQISAYRKIAATAP